MRKFFGAITAAASVAAIAALALVATASAHAPYDSSTPAKGAVLDTAPATVVINFAEDIQSTSGSYGMTVKNAAGTSVTAAPVTVSGDAQLTVALTSGLSAGRYVVNWNNTAADDGDKLEGAFSFYVQTQPTATDLANDAVLAQVGAEELATATAAAAPTVAPSAPSAPASPAAPSAPAPVVTRATGTLPSTGTGSGAAGDSFGWLLIAATVGGAGVILSMFAFRTAKSRR